MWNKKQILDALRANDKENMAFVLPCTEALASPFLQKQLAILKEQASIYMSRPLPPLLYKDFKLFRTTGDRISFQNVYYEQRGRLLCFSLLSWLTQKPDYIAALEDIIWAICAEPFWCIPAHFTDVDVQPVPFEEYSTQLDLFACETAFALAETLQLNDLLLDPLVKQQLLLQLKRRVFTPFLSGDRFFRFEQMSNNWSAVCAGAIGGAAISTEKDTLRLTNLLHQALSSIDVFLDSFGDDGICVEGVDYWTYGFGFFTCFAELLLRRTKGALNLFLLSKVQAIAKSQQAFYLQAGCTISFSDGSEQAQYRLGIGSFLQATLPGIKLPPQNLAADINKDSCHRFCLALRDFAWFSKSAQLGNFATTHSEYYPDVQWFVSATPSITLVAKAGNNNESHNHNDCGSFILQNKKDILLCDLGAGLYDETYFSSKRYSVFVNSSRSHNVALVEGQQQCAGAKFAASAPIMAFGEEVDVFETKLENCYNLPNLLKYTRKFAHHKNQQRLVLQDTFVFKTLGEICEVFVSRCPFVLNIAGQVQLQGQGAAACAVLRYDAETLAAHTFTEVYIDHDAQPQTAHLLHLASIHKVAQLVVNIEIEALI